MQSASENVSTTSLKTGVQLVIDSTPEQDIVDLLHWRISRLRAKERAEAQLLRTMAGFAPAFGMVGTLVGLVNLLFLLGDGDMTAIGQQMAQNAVKSRHEGQRHLLTYRSEEHTSELQSLMRISYAVFCLKKKNRDQNTITRTQLTQNKHTTTIETQRQHK